MKSVIRTNKLLILKRTNMRNFIFSLMAMLFLGTGVYGQETLKDLGKNGEYIYNYAYDNAKELNGILSQNNYKDLDAMRYAKPEVIDYLKSTNDLKNFTGFEFIKFAKVVVDYGKLHNGKPNFDSDDFKEYLFGKNYKEVLGEDGQATSKGFWRGLWRGIKKAAEWIWNNVEEIIDTIERICALPWVNC